MGELNLEGTNQDDAGAGVAPDATKPEVPAGSEVPPKAEDTTPAPTTIEEAMHILKVDGKEEKLPLSKVLEFAQQGRYYAQKVGQHNQDVEAKATELANAAVEKWMAEQAPKPEAPGSEKPLQVDDPVEDEPEEVDEFTQVKTKLESIESQLKKDRFEKEVGTIQKEINEQLTQAKRDFPLMSERNVLAILRSKPDADIMELAKNEHRLELDRQENWKKEYLKEAGERGKRGAEGAGGVVPAPKGKRLTLGEDTLEAAEQFLMNAE